MRVPLDCVAEEASTLSLGDEVIAQCDFEADRVVVVRPDMRGVIKSINKDGHVDVKFESYDTNTRVSYKDLDKLSKARVGDKVDCLANYDYDGKRCAKAILALSHGFWEEKHGPKGSAVLCEFPNMKRTSLDQDPHLQARYQRMHDYVEKLCQKVVQSPEKIQRPSWSASLASHLITLFSFGKCQAQNEKWD